MADHSDDEGTRGGERAHDQASATMNIFDWRSASKEEVAAFVEQRKEDYKDKHLYDFVLWELFKEDFEGFTEEAFEKVGKSKASGLRLLLRTHGVWVQHDRGKNLYPSLCSTLQEDKPAIWPMEEIHEHKDKYGQFISGLINTRLRELKQANQFLQTPQTTRTVQYETPTGRTSTPSTAEEQLERDQAESNMTLNMPPTNMPIPNMPPPNMSQNMPSNMPIRNEPTSKGYG